MPAAFNQVVFTNGDVEQQLAQLAAYLNQLGYPVDVNVAAALEKQPAAELFRAKLLPGCSLFWTEPSGPGFQRILHLLLALLQLDEKNISHNVPLVAEPMLAAPGEKFEEKNYFLGQLFNALNAECPVRYQVLKYLVQLNIAAGDIEKLASDLYEDIGNLLKQCSASAEQQQQLLSAISQAVESENPMLAFNYEIKNMATYGDADAKSIAKRVLQKSLQLPSFFDYSALLINKQILQIKGEKLYSLLEILVGGPEMTARFQDFCKQNGNVFTENGLSVDQITKKMRLLSVCSLAASVIGADQTLSYEKVAQSLSISNEQVESLLIEASCLDLVDGKLDQSKALIHIQRVRDVKFETRQWEKLGKLIESLRGKISVMAERVELAKPVVEAAADPVELIGR